MANEAVLQIETHIPINFNVSSDVTIEKGAIVKLGTGMAATSHTTGINDLVAGIVQSEKLAADTTQDSVAVFRGGVFNVKCSGACPVGSAVVTSSVANTVEVAGANSENILGIMLDTAADGETKLMELRPTKMDLA